MNERGLLGRVTEVGEGVGRPVGAFGGVRRKEHPSAALFSGNLRVVGSPFDAVDK
jgi:hypothetical protein